MGVDDLAAAGIHRSPGAQVLSLAELAWLAGCDGFVASPQETAALRAKFGSSPLLVIPGIRPAATSEAGNAGAAKSDDQTRTATPRAALEGKSALEE